MTALVDKGKATAVTYLDFVMVLHHMLIFQLERCGFEECTISCIKNWLDCHIQSIVVNGSRTRWRPVMSGVP